MEVNLEKVIDFMKKKMDPDFLVLFGSQVTQRVHPESDVDLAFYKHGHNLSAYDVFCLAGELAAEIKQPVDLIDLKQASTVFKAQIVGKGKMIYTKDLYLYENYQLTAISMYLNLNIERRGILQAIQERGSVYGNRE